MSKREATDGGGPLVGEFSFSTPPKRGTTLSVAVAEHIETQIVSGTLIAGMMLPPERVLGIEFGVSRTVIREAMKSLEREGLVEILHGKGVRVSVKSAGSVADSIERYILMTPSPLWSLLELRRLIEAGAVVLAAERRTDAELAELEATIEAMRGHLDQPLRYVQLDFQLHRLFYRATQNPLVEVVLEPFVRLLEESRRLGANARQAPHRSIDVHQRIVDAIRDQDPERARQAIEDHFDRVEQFLAESVTRPATMGTRGARRSEDG